jgi:hypothetical protein
VELKVKLFHRDALLCELAHGDEWGLIEARKDQKYLVVFPICSISLVGNESPLDWSGDEAKGENRASSQWLPSP